MDRPVVLAYVNAYCRVWTCDYISLFEKSRKLSFATFSNVLAKFVLSRENSFALSLACCKDVFHASMLANSTLFANLLDVIVLSVRLLTALA